MKSAIAVFSGVPAWADSTESLNQRGSATSGSPKLVRVQVLEKVRPHKALYIKEEPQRKPRLFRTWLRGPRFNNLVLDQEPK
jgi:hypothetical protein